MHVNPFDDWLFSIQEICFFKVLDWWKDTKGESLFTKNKWCITNIIVHNKLKSWWHTLVIQNTSKTFNFVHDNILEHKINFEPIVRWGGLDKINVKEYITYNFAMTIGLHVCVSWNINKQTKIDKKCNTHL